MAGYNDLHITRRELLNLFLNQDGLQIDSDVAHLIFRQLQRIVAGKKLRYFASDLKKVAILPF